MSVDQPPQEPSLIPELAPLRDELKHTNAPDHLHTDLVAAFRAAHNKEPTQQPEKAAAWGLSAPALSSLAACLVIGIAIAALLPESKAPTESAQTADASKQTSASPTRSGITVSATGPIYTRMTVPVQTHSLTNGPSLRFVNTLTYQNKNGLSRAVFVRNPAAPN